MKDLFEMDRKNYNPDGKVYTRPSARAIIVRGDTVLLMYSKKYGYFKFPGGGIEPGESHAETIIREVKEESGYLVKPDTIEEYGRVVKRECGQNGPDEIFEQENFYYFCEVEDNPVETDLDDYEAEEVFTPCFVISWKVIRWVFFGRSRTSIRCQEIDSPSRSSSVASQISSAALAAFFSSEIILVCPGSIS